MKCDLTRERSGIAAEVAAPLKRREAGSANNLDAGLLKRPAGFSGYFRNATHPASRSRHRFAATGRSMLLAHAMCRLTHDQGQEIIRVR